MSTVAEAVRGRPTEKTRQMGTCLRTRRRLRYTVGDAVGYPGSDVSDEPPKKRRGPRRAAPILPATVPAREDAPPPDEREQLANWWRRRMDQIEAEHAERIELLRTVGEHPSPVFSKQVRMLGALGMPRTLAAKLLGLSAHTLQTHYGEEYDIGAADVIASVAANMIRIGTSTSDPANAKVGMDILSRRGGQEWRPPAQKVEMETEVKEKNVIDSSRLSFEERQQLRLMIERVQMGGDEPPESAEDEPVAG